MNMHASKYMLNKALLKILFFCHRISPCLSLFFSFTDSWQYGGL